MTGIEVALIATAVVGTLVSAVGQFSAMKAQAKGKAFEADVAERNARVARKQAAVDSEDARREKRRRLASIKAAFGSKGFSLSGSPLDVLADQSAEFELAAQRESYAGEIRAIGYTDTAAASRMEQRALNTGATVGLIGGVAQSAASGLGTAYNIGVI